MKNSTKKTPWKKILIISLSAIALIAVLMLVGILPIPRLFGDENEQINNSVTVLNNYNIEVLTYGEDCHLPDGVKETKITSIKDIDYDSYKETQPCLVINDNNGTVQLTDDETEYIRTLIYEKKMPVMYLGEKYLGTWYDNYVKDNSGNKGIDFVCMGGQVTPITGFWGKTELGYYAEDVNFMGKCIVWEIESGYIRHAN